MDADHLARLDCECREALPEKAARAIALFNVGDYYAQHDLLEELWRETGGPVRDLYQGILQVGIAYYQIERGNYRGALKMLRRAASWMAPLPEDCQGVDVRALREDSARVDAALAALFPEQIEQFDKTLLRPVKTTSSP